jgi:hypothetical protein
MLMLYSKQLQMNNSIFAALVVGALAIAMVAATVVTPDALAIRGEAGNHIPQQADDHMSDQGKISAGCIGTLENCPDAGGDGGDGDGGCSGDDTPEGSEEEQCDDEEPPDQEPPPDSDA